MDIFSEIFGDIWNEFDMISHMQQAEKEQRCPLCNSSISDIRKSGKAGCSECFDFFRSTMEMTLRQIHQNSAHMGKIPSKAGRELKEKRHLDTLKKQLEDAVRNEDYESAAKIHKEIKAIEQD